MKEIWKPVVGYEDSYEVSDLGHVRRAHAMGRNTIAGHVLSPGVGAHGHHHVSLFKEGHKSQLLVHRLVALAFIGAPPPGREIVCHNDGDPFNNRVDNLRWDTQSSNIIDSVTHGNHRNTRKVQCIRGHDLSGENLYRRSNGRRECRTCIRDRVQRRMQSLTVL